MTDLLPLSWVSLISAISFVVFLLLGYWKPRRKLSENGLSTSLRRTLHNLLLFAFNTLVMRIGIPLTLIASALWAQQHHYGVFNYFLVDPAAVVVISIIFLDFAVYWQHVVTHKVPILWCLHKVHHADHEMDVTTAVRFHPIELILSLGFKALMVVLLGAPVVAVVLFELMLFVGPAFNHSNWALPKHLDSALRYFLVTPDVHRSHHSVERSEQNSNYGFFLIWWDRLFSSYTESPSKGHQSMQIGVVDERYEKVHEMLIAPFR